MVFGAMAAAVREFGEVIHAAVTLARYSSSYLAVLRVPTWQSSWQKTMSIARCNEFLLAQRAFGSSGQFKLEVRREHPCQRAPGLYHTAPN
jgi:hypothetical protein